MATDVGATPIFSQSFNTQPSPTITFLEALEQLSDAIVEGMRGVLVARIPRNQSVGLPSALQQDDPQMRSTPT